MMDTKTEKSDAYTKRIDQLKFRWLRTHAN